MEASTTINKMLTGTKIIVPSYQRAYSWETPSDKNIRTQTDVFLSDLDEYNKSLVKTPYYFGHFLFEEKERNLYGVIDGQQRLTTIVIFLSALFTRLKQIRDLTEDEEVLYENMIKRKSNYIFSTVDYDNQLFRDYVIDQWKKDKRRLETESSKRIVNAFDFFSNELAKKDDIYITKMLNTISEASCSTHPVMNESEAIQMFIFQNNRGKKPSNLEIIKAQFMFNVHLYGGEAKDNLIEEIKFRFEKIYKSISSIEYKIDEDDVLSYTLRVHFNSLWETNAIERLNKLLSDGNPIPFIQSFTNSLATSFEHLTTFLGKDERDNIEIHSLVTLGRFTLAIPFIIKAYSYNLSIVDICKICTSIESLILRHKLIGTRADLTTRLNEVYQKFTQENSTIQPIIDRVEFIKAASNENWWWAYWNRFSLQNSIQGYIEHSTAKFILWKYENFLESQGKNGYEVTRFDKIKKPHLEHIAPQTENEKPASGYGRYTESFREQCIDCLGNYLLLSAPHNESIGNKDFKIKRESYTQLAQQREIQQMTKDVEVWNREMIEVRHKKIVTFLLDNF
jgi:hypothetical protein